MRIPRPGWIVAGLVVGLATGLLLLREPAEPLTPERLEAARSLWSKSGPASYEFEIELRGSLQDRRKIVVRDGRVVGMTTDGVPVPESVWPYWSVDGMLGFLEQELDNSADPRRAFGVTDPDQIVLQATFDRKLGYPSRFLRHILGTQRSLEWRTISFQSE